MSAVPAVAGAAALLFYTDEDFISNAVDGSGAPAHAHREKKRDEDR
jgi:hypothetical protein